MTPQTWFNAAKKGLICDLEKGLQQGIFIDLPDPHEGRTALGWAVYYHQEQAVAFLLQAGANPEKLDDERFSPIDWAKFAHAVCGGYEQCLHLLHTSCDK